MKKKKRRVLQTVKQTWGLLSGSFCQMNPQWFLCRGLAPASCTPHDRCSELQPWLPPPPPPHPPAGSSREDKGTGLEEKVISGKDSLTFIMVPKNDV